MKVGDLVRWAVTGRDPGKIGIVINIEGIWYTILWEDGRQNANPKWQMEVINENR